MGTRVVLVSRAVTVGEHVKAGQFLGKVGFSGDSLFPHMHYNVTDGARYPSQGMPVYFRDFVREVGSRAIPVSIGEVDTGDLIQREERCP
jgi:murein DD-endopeptidase MepM/ murein hydrolase activator NlpD